MPSLFRVMMMIMMMMMFSQCCRQWGDYASLVAAGHNGDSHANYHDEHHNVTMLTQAKE